MSTMNETVTGVRGPAETAAPSTMVGGRGLTAQRLLLHVEGAVLAVGLIAIYRIQGGSWGLFAALILAPDLFMLGYRAGPVWGARVYNFGHTYAVPTALALGGVVLPVPWLTSAALIWLAHIAVDRALGFGLKYPTAFSHTHFDKV